MASDYKPDVGKAER